MPPKRKGSTNNVTLKTKKARSKFTRGTTSVPASGSGAAGGGAAGTASGTAGAATGAAGASGAAAGSSGGSEAAGAPTAANADPKPKTRRKQHGIAPDNVPEFAKATQRAFQRHIRMACSLFTADAVLTPADDFIDHYDKRFDGDDDMEAHVRSLVDVARQPNADALKRAKRLLKEAKVVADGDGAAGEYGNIARDIAEIPAEHISFFYGAVSKAGLKTFHPDVFGPLQSTYNVLHRHIAVSTFSNIAQWHGFSALEVSVNVATDYHLLSEMYDNFVYGTIKGNSHKEFNTPGSLALAHQRQNAVKRRARRSDARYQKVKQLGYRKPILRMANEEATHSDDERVPGGDSRKKRGLLKFPKSGRNVILGAFYDTIDAKIKEPLGRTPGARHPEDRKLHPDTSKTSRLSRILPEGIPIDYFDPEFFNKLDPRERAKYAKTGVAFPLPQYCTNEHHSDWAKMGKKDFMVKYGNDVLKLYNLPTAEELAAFEAEDKQAEEDGEPT
ncbi:hypothetical protein FB45DRAFT_1129986 [Roridomyces roridus]|uniref:Uncharacterized protein n=1 Tax=Roridomyces roridus TaxID=1738132 RepID=A0AAD7B309_9AGAR|nr:hypothetical protein FB45DRAFT_1129986 [Roridomyces roridus]